jgi:hypothetical protein
VSAWAPDATELEALKKLWLMAQHDNGGARVCSRLPFGLYNGQRFPFDLTDLRLLDDEYPNAALTVLRMDARPAMEVHELLARHCGWKGMGARFEVMACDWHFKGKCSKENEASARAFLKTLPPAQPAPAAAGATS